MALAVRIASPQGVAFHTSPDAAPQNGALKIIIINNLLRTARTSCGTSRRHGYL